MIVDKTVLNKVKAIGLNSYEAKIWTALLSRGVSTAGEISDIANVPRSRSYDVLESLEKKGFIITKIGKPIQYIAVPPEEVLDRVKDDIREEAEEKVAVLEEFEASSMLDKLQRLHEEGIESVDPTEITGFLQGTDNIFDHIRMLVKEADDEVYLAPNDEWNEWKDRLEDELATIKESNITLTVSSNTTGTRLVVIDGSTSCFFITNETTHESYETAVWVESPVLASTFAVKDDVTVKAEMTKKVTE
jgi:sugar-specific transcriptional regulator TrmB